MTSEPDISEFNLFDPHTTANLVELFTRARAECPVARSEKNGGYYLVTRYEDCVAVGRDWETFASDRGRDIPPRPVTPMPPIHTDPPIQRDYRKLLNPFFSPKTVAEYEPQMHDVAARLVEKLAQKNSAEWIEEFAAALPAAVLSEMILNLDDPAEVDFALKSVYRITHDMSEEAHYALADYVGSMLRSPKLPSIDRSGVLTAVVNGSVDGRPLTFQEQVGVVVLLIEGALDTTKATLGSILLRVAQRPELEQRLRDPGWIRTDLDEFFRYDSAVIGHGRKVTKRTVLNGQQLEEGDLVLVCWNSANRDESKFPNAHELDFERESNPHLTFGLGPHRCIGLNLARLTIKVAFEEVLARLTNFRLAEGFEEVWATGPSRQLTRLDVTYEVLS
jgi:cytochrome P450